MGATVEAKHPDKNQFLEAVISKIQDCSQYTVVFDDGDITTLRRSALCLKSGRHFNESETLDQLPLTHPEHFSNPVVGGTRRGGGVRRRIAIVEEKDSSEDESASSSSQKGKNKKGEVEVDFGKVVCVEISDKKKGSRDPWFPALVVSPAAQETVKIKVKDECLVRSFKDGR
jgi:Ras-related protein Rab-1A